MREKKKKKKINAFMKSGLLFTQLFFFLFFPFCLLFSFSSSSFITQRLFFFLFSDSWISLMHAQLRSVVRESIFQKKNPKTLLLLLDFSLFSFFPFFLFFFFFFFFRFNFSFNFSFFCFCFLFIYSLIFFLYST